MKITTKNIGLICLGVIIIFVLFHILISNKYVLDTEIVLVYIQIINAAIIILLTVQVYLYNKEKDKIDFKTKTPLISITQEDYSGNYYIQNIGGGPALNIRVLSDLDVEKKVWKINIIAFDLFGNNSFLLDNTNKEQYLIIYNDIYENQYYSYMKGNKLLFGSISDNNRSFEKIYELLQYRRSVEQFSIRHIPSV